MQDFAEFFFTFERFPGTIDHLPIIPMGETPSFVKKSDIISPSWLYQNYNYDDMRGLVSVHFLVALNIYFGGNSTLPKDVMSKFFHSLSMQAMSISDDSIVLQFNAMKKLNKNINDLINTNIHMQKKRAVISEIQTIVGDEPTINNKSESIPLTDVDGDDDVDVDISDIPLARVAEKIEPEIDDFGVNLQKLFQANIRSDQELVFKNVIGVNDWMNKIKEDHETREPKLDREA